MARLRSAPAIQQAKQQATQRLALKEKTTNTSRSTAPVYEDDGNTENLVKDARPRRGRPKAARAQQQNENEFVMAGGLGAVSDDKVTGSHVELPTTDELVRSDVPSAPAVRVGRRPPVRKVKQSEAQSKIMQDMKKRMEATACKEIVASSVPDPTNASAQRQSNGTALERSEYSLSPSPPPPGKLHATKQRSSLEHPSSVLKSHGTPAVESSILALKNFKRRPRQPSMLQMVQQQQRLASARPSAVHVPATEELSVYDVEDEGEGDDEDDFVPEAEGTPAHVRKKAPAVKARRPSAKQQRAETSSDQLQAVSSAGKRKAHDGRTSLSALVALQSKRQKSMPAEIDDDLPILNDQRIPSIPSDWRDAPHVEGTSEIQVINSSPSSTPPTEPSSPEKRRPSVVADEAIPSTEEAQDDVQFLPLNDPEGGREEGLPNDTLAEPVSSPSIQGEPNATQRTDILADPLTQLSPPRNRDVQPTKKKKKAAPVTTTILQSLLPKRRQPPKPRHRKSEYDFDQVSEDAAPLDSGHLGEDEDELGSGLRRKTTTAKMTKGRKSKAPVSNAKSRQSKAALTKRKSAAPRKSSKPTRTYGKAGDMSDKENEELDEEEEDSVLPDISLSMHEALQSRELEAAKRKFEMVDEWDMEFESMSVEDHRSSSQGWR